MLTQAALDLIRDVRQAHADAALARDKLRIAEDAVRLRGQISQLADARLRAGDISVQEATTARIDLLRAQQDRARVSHDVSLADERLRLLMGMGADRTPLQLTQSRVPTSVDLDPGTLCVEAIATRPDVLAANEQIAAAVERLQLAQINWIRFNGILDATSGQRTGHEFGPALRMTLPVFNWNQGGKVRAQAELEKAEHQRQALEQQIAYEVRQAHHRYAQVRAELEILSRQVRPEVEAAIQRAESAYREGLAPYVVVLETTRQLLDSRFREVQLHSDQRRAWAELERSVGRKLDTQPMIAN
jgi:cobalt-zinc-cadmium efflux system outer membrane protein